ncbi:uncharacterized protein LOC114306625 [Camellia sinensis]|uniref:uncharacterized protein LOC114306625 n=1 Tax=Camellia sinensis TaxID=4442 RepID=UPI001035DFAF|nr:uncharacterized protein LOC114306625 [Camellia sinensis]
MVKTLSEFRIQVESQDTKACLSAQKVMPKLRNEVMEAQKHYQEVAYIKGCLESGEPMPDWVIHLDESLRYQGRLFVPSDELLREKVLEECHHSAFAVHPGRTKMYQDLKRQYWWNGIKKEVAKFVTKCIADDPLVVADDVTPRDDITPRNMLGPENITTQQALNFDLVAYTSPQLRCKRLCRQSWIKQSEMNRV